MKRKVIVIRDVTGKPVLMLDEPVPLFQQRILVVMARANRALRLREVGKLLGWNCRSVGHVPKTVQALLRAGLVTCEAHKAGTLQLARPLRWKEIA
jgi:hypothetical protein